MRRFLLVPSVVLLASVTPGCALGPTTPSMTAADWAEPPVLHDARLPARADALSAWTLPATSPWAGYAKYTLLTSLGEASGPADLPDVSSLDDVRAARAAAERVAVRGLPSDALWVIDMRGAASVAFGEALARGATAGLVTLVPTFNNWPDEHEVIPAEETLAAMVNTPPTWQAEQSEGAQPVFLLDAWRMANRSDEPDDEAYDNRYMLSPSDLPSAAILRAHGIRQVIYVVASLDDTTLEEDDVHPVFLDWQAAGLPIAMVDLATLNPPAPSVAWDAIYAARALVVEPRVTLVDDPAFYVRARGGFGGIHARPVRIGAGFGFGGHGGHGGGFGGHGGGG